MSPSCVTPIPGFVGDDPSHTASWIVNVTGLPGDNVDVGMQDGLACGLTGAALEAISHHGLDNLTVQIVASATAWLLLS